MTLEEVQSAEQLEKLLDSSEVGRDHKTGTKKKDDLFGKDFDKGLKKGFKFKF